MVDANPGTPRSYVVDSDGITVRRNRRALRELSQSSSPHPQSACPQLEHTDVKVETFSSRDVDVNVNVNVAFRTLR